jgi:hypothetical protein
MLFLVGDIFYEICLKRQILVNNGRKITTDPKENIFGILLKTTYPGGKRGMEIQEKATGDKKENDKFVLIVRDETEI